MTNHFDVNEVRHVERFVVGTTHPLKPLTESEKKQQLDKLNRALRYGIIITTEQNFTIIEESGRELITTYVVYHVGFKHKI